VADRFQVTEVVSAVEDAIIGQLSAESCADVLSWGGVAWLERAEAAARKLAMRKFEDVAATAGFLRMSEETLGSLLEADGLVVAMAQVACD
jgi:hypothetical protein